MKKSILFFLFSGISILCEAQLRPGQLYDSGQEIYAPRYGVKTTVPDGWVGVLPMNTEVFLLMPRNNSAGEIYVMAQEDTYEELKSRWIKGVELDNGVIAKAMGEPGFREDVLASKIEIAGNKSTAGYVEAKCGDFGICLVAFLFAPPDKVARLSEAIISFTDNLRLVEPLEVDPYANFDWKEFLGNKYMANYERLQGSKKESEIWFCPDGTFRSKLKIKGVFAEQSKEYSGNKSGTWKVEASGPSTTLTLSFKKLNPISFNLTIEEEKIYANGDRFFFMQDNTCK